MKKSVLFRALMIVVVATGLFAGAAGAMPGGTWASGIKIQNLDSVATATLVIELYSAGGGAPAFTIDKTAGGTALTAAAGKSVEVYLPNFSSVTAGQYSAVVRSDVQIGAVVTTTNYAYGMADSYNSMAPATTVTVPYVYHNHNNWSTEIFVQNTSATTAANVTVSMKEPVGGSSSSDGLGDKSVDLVIPAGGTQSVDTSQAGYSTMGWFIGSATVTSTNSVPVAVVANQIRLVGTGDALGNVMISARGMTSSDSSTKILLPSLYKEFVGSSGTWRSGIKIANPGTLSADVTVTFTADSDQAAFTGTKTVTVAGGDNAEIYLPTAVLTTPASGSIPNQFKGFAVVTSTQPVVATVQHTNYAGASGYGVAIGYAGFGGGSSKISLPSLYNWPSGAGVWVSGIKIQNYGTASATFNVAFTADPDSVSTVSGTKNGLTLTPGQAVELFFGTMTLDGGGTIPSSWKGSAVITGGATDQLVATVIHTNYGRHVANMYTGVPMP